MKWIDKRVSPSFFDQWKADFTTINGRTPQYDDLVGEPRQKLKEHLLKEQGYLCCYCMSEIDLWNSHFEHFIPRSAPKRNPQQYAGQDIELGYENLFLSCEGEHYQKDRCGRYKDDKPVDSILSPANPIINSVFKYTVNGHMSSLDTKASNLITIANLESAALVRHRDTAIYNSGFFDEDFEEKKEALLHLYREKDEQGAYMPFCMAVLYIMETQP